MKQDEVPAPKRGGTFFYCPWRKRTVKSGGRVTVTTCGWPAHGHIRPRFRTAAKYRRHWRLFHG